MGQPLHPAGSVWKRVPFARPSVQAIPHLARACGAAARMYHACMPNVQVRDVPDDVHAALVRRAELAGQSLQQFLAAQLATIATTPTVDEILDRIERRSKGRLSADDAVDALHEERARR
jgi:uncharacterized membrane protein YccC